MRSATHTLVSFVREVDAEQSVLDHAARCVLDLTGVAIAGAQTPMAKIGASFAREQFAAGGCAVIASRATSSATGATWINATSASALDMDDGNRIAMGHPGANVIPAALAIAEQTQASGRQFLNALVAGYEVAVRASAARVAWYKDEMYSTGIWGVFGATAAAGKLLCFDEVTLQSALGIAGSHGVFPPGGMQSLHAMVKETIAWSAMTGISSALLARDGFIGPADFFDYTKRWDTASLVDGLGAKHAILNTYFKPYAVCRWAHAAVDAALSLKHRHALAIDDIEAIDVASFYEVTRLGEYEPRNTIAAQFSMPFAIAAALLHDKISPAEVSEAHIGDAALLALARKVHLSVDDELDREFPEKTISRVTLRTRRGEFQATVEYPRGNPENPLSDAELDAKFVELTHDLVSDERSRALRDAIRELPRAPSVSTFTKLLQY